MWDFIASVVFVSGPIALGVAWAYRRKSKPTPVLVPAE